MLCYAPYAIELMKGSEPAEVNFLVIDNLSTHYANWLIRHSADLLFLLLQPKTFGTSNSLHCPDPVF